MSKGRPRSSSKAETANALSGRTETGNTRYTTEVVANEMVQLLGSRGGGGGEDFGGGGGNWEDGPGDVGGGPDAGDLPFE